MRLAIIGGGITGLAAAHRALELSREHNTPLELHLFEASARLGGSLQTVAKDGCLMEGGPDCFVTEKPGVLFLAKRLGIEDQLIPTNPEHRRSFIVKGKRLLPVPEGVYLMAPASFEPFLASPLISWPGKLRMGLDYVLPRRKSNEDESLAGFVRRRLGREALERLAQPMIAGIYAADPNNLSLQATFPRFIEMEQKYGSVIRGLRARASASTRQASGPRYSLFMSFKNGMETLARELEKRIPHSAIYRNTKIKDLKVEAGSWKLEAESGKSFEADAVCVALPAPAAADLLRPLKQDLSRLLGEIPYTSAMTINLVWRRRHVPHALNGFGFVVPALEQREIIGCTFSNVKFAGRAPEDLALLRVFLKDGDVETVRAELKALLGITHEPLFHFLWKQRAALPQYTVGHVNRVQQIERQISRRPGLALAGNAYHGIGIPDCVASGEKAVDQLLASSFKL